MFISGTSGNVTYDQQMRLPFMYNGHSLKLNYSKPIYEMNITQTSGGTLAAAPLSGESGTKFNFTATPQSNHHHLSSYNVSGTTMTGTSGTYTNSDVSAKPSWYEDPKYTLTVQQSTGGTLAGAPSSGYSGDKFGLTPTPSAKYSLVSYSVTGATMTGNSGTFKNSNVTAKANWQYNPETITLKTINIVNQYLPMIQLSTASNGFLGLRQSVQGNNVSFGVGANDVYNNYKPGKTTVISAWPQVSGCYRCYAFPTFYGNVTGSYVSAISGGTGDEFVSLAYKCYSGDWKKYFGNNQSQFSSYSHGTPTTYEYFNKVPYGINFGNSAFISGFVGYAIFKANSGTSFEYRTIHKGVTSNWTTGRMNNGTGYIYVRLEDNELHTNEPFIIDFSAHWPGNNIFMSTLTDTDWTWEPGQSVSQHTVHYPCWSGKLCYKE